ncbi:MAG: copper homeostasis membrane protein CopD [Phenylobacterium sp.]|uniref:copper homeostasis membrane protein CopD n=1 Tax=Phenylobacterium sp. TaxID=1871053 RepID=UPI001A43C6FE|nr:copper homeostasis membrane protein CopD [Phenylobacterium sp.]MBL8552868.1 copper homeostasis membrane protein CopD [Phenylobacterium sp.]
MVVEPAVIPLRLAQYGGAAILFGSSLFCLYALPVGLPPRLPWLRPLLVWSAATLLIASLAGLVAQTIVLAGSVAEGLQPASLSAVVTTMGLGRAAVVRGAAAALALAVLLMSSMRRPALIVTALAGGAACGSFGWMGHGGATEGPGGGLHLTADILHALAAGVWVGALVAFLALLSWRRHQDAVRDAALQKALQGFAGVGSVLVATLVATGLINSWFLIGPTRLSGLWTTPYGQLLSLKLVVFLAMLGLAAANRFRLTPDLGLALSNADFSRGRWTPDLGAPLSPDGPTETAVRALRRSLLLETSLGFAVLALVAWFGMLAPVSAQ